MPLKIIEFDHEGQTVKAEVLYNFHNLSNTVIIIPLGNTHPLNENILLTRKKGRWRTSSPLKQLYPSTVSNIIGCVNEELHIKILEDHVSSFLDCLS